MSTQKRKTDSEEGSSNNQKTVPQCMPIENESLSLKSSCTACRDVNCEDCVTDHNDDQSNENCFLLIGDHENQLSEGGEADLHKHRKNCKKNPGHPEYIPIESFSLKHLPEGYQDSDLYECIKATADLTVKLSVHMTSPERPEFWPNTKKPYLLSDMRGKKTLRTGSGRMWSVVKFTDKDKHRKYGRTTCLCDKCKVSYKPSKVWWEISVDTAAHVVVDDIEASHTTVTLFYDREDSEVVILKDKVRVGDVNIEADWCRLYCVTCDENLANKLKKIEKHFYDVWEKVINIHSETWETNEFNFIVSHPHGCNKQVSLGQVKDRVKVRDDEGVCQLTYTTCTCPGSSGAHVHCVGGDWFGHVHSGSSKSGVNYSSVI